MIECAFTGRLGKDAELRHVKGGELTMVSFSAVVDGKDADPDNPTWIRCVAFGGLAEQMAERLVKGVRVYCEGRLEASIWTPESGPPRLNLNVTAITVQPLGHIGRNRPRATRNAERGQRTWDRARDAGRARAAGEAVLREARRDRAPEAPQSWINDYEAAAADLEPGPGR
jgi:single stranded DNA-binding protein